MTERIKNQYELIQKQVGKAEKLFEDDDFLPEALLNTFTLIENCANIIKDIHNNFPKTRHSDIDLVLKDLFRRKLLKQDYATYHKELNDYRAKAFFGEYSREKKVLPPKASLKIYLVKAKELFHETKKIVEAYLKQKK